MTELQFQELMNVLKAIRNDLHLRPIVPPRMAEESDAERSADAKRSGDSLRKIRELADEALSRYGKGDYFNAVMRVQDIRELCRH